MITFHSQFSTLTSLKCFISFRGLQLRPSSAECLHCSRDLRTLKLYTCANNMDPGKLPPQLQVSSILLNCCKMCIVILLQYLISLICTGFDSDWRGGLCLLCSLYQLHVPTGLWRRGILQIVSCTMSPVYLVPGSTQVAESANSLLHP